MCSARVGFKRTVNAVCTVTAHADDDDDDDDDDDCYHSCCCCCCSTTTTTLATVLGVRQRLKGLAENAPPRLVEPGISAGLGFWGLGLFRFKPIVQPCNTGDFVNGLWCKQNAPEGSVVAIESHTHAVGKSVDVDTNTWSFIDAVREALTPAPSSMSASNTWT